MLSFRDSKGISRFYAYIYYGFPCGWFNRPSPEHRKIAEELRKFLLSYQEESRVYGYFGFDVGDMNDELIGIHTQPMFSLSIRPDVFQRIFSFLILNRNGLSVLIRPYCGELKDQYTKSAIWLGDRIPVDLSHLTKKE